jgi:hypothetical protein
MTTTVLAPTEFADAIERYYNEAYEDARQVIVGLKEQSQEAEIYARHSHLFTTGQLEALASARESATDEREQEMLRRLWFEAASAVAAADVVQASQDLTNDRLAWRTTWDGEEVSYNTVQALLTAEPDYDRREQLYELICQADEEFAPRELDLAVTSQKLRSEVFGLDGEIAIAEGRMQLDLRALSNQLSDLASRTTADYDSRCEEIFPLLLGRDETVPSRGQSSWIRSLHIYDDIYTKERMVDVCERTVAELGFPLDKCPTILPDLEDRPQKSPRACVIPVRVPEEVHLVVRPTGGITDYQAFLHEAGHALHYGLASADLPFELRFISPDHALTEIWSYVVERITHIPAWHERHFGVDRETAERVCAHVRFIDATLYRRYAAKLQYELEFWGDPANPKNPERYAMLLSNATHMRYPTSQYVSDMDAGLYAADYLRAWRTSEQVLLWLEREFGEDWFCNGKAGDWLRSMFAQGTTPTNEDVSRQIGGSPDNFDALQTQLSA